MNNIMKVFLFELKTKLKEKTIIISTLVMLVLAFGVTFVPRFTNIVPDQDKIAEEQMETFKKTGYVIEDDRIDKNELTKEVPFVFGVSYSNKEELKKAIVDKKMEFGIVVLKSDEYVLLKDGSNVLMYSDFPLVVEEGIKNYNKTIYLKSNNIDPEVVAKSNKIEVKFSTEEIGKSAEKNYFVAYIGVFVIYMIIIIYGTSVATSVAREKNDRTMELLITNTSSTSLIVGKVFSSLLVSIGQVTLTIISALLGLIINKSTYPEQLFELVTQNISAQLIIVFLVFIFLGSLLYYFVYAALGSLVSRVEDVSNAVGPIQIIFVAAFLIATYGMYDPSGSLITIGSYIPFTSPMAMFVKYSMTEVGLFDIILSLSLLILTTILLAYFSIKIYRKATLNYGNKLSLVKIIKDLKIKNN